jgi:uncharacterized lipoprotein YddW (UPF0748 family)
VWGVTTIRDYQKMINIIYKYICMTSLRNLLLLLLVLSTAACTQLSKTAPTSTPEIPEVEQIDREFRAAWVATVANINWPSEPGLSIMDQKAEALLLLDLLEKNNFNAVIFQVRPQGDALYKSDLEPWSYYLTGQQGVGPEDPDFDPLDFWINEAHKRNIELHVWLNPYRAHHPSGGPVSEFSVVKTMPELVAELEGGYWWFIPTMKGTQDHSHAVVMDIVDRYDIDGVHFDDYFYPYPSYNGGKDFPDEKSWNAYQDSGGKLSKSDWRRNGVDTFIERLYDSIKKEKPHVKFGISPFGIWRPDHPKSIKGFDQHEVLFADARKWLREGWVDYYTPQLYWPINQIPQSFSTLLGWWKDQNVKERHLWPGMSIGRYQGERQRDEVVNQIMVTRGIVREAPGAVHWSIAPLVGDDTLQTALRNGPYRNSALVPASPWMSDQKKVDAPEITVDENGMGVRFEINQAKENMNAWIVYVKYGEDWIKEIVPRTQRLKRINIVREILADGEATQVLAEKVMVSYLNRSGIESDKQVFVIE